MRTGLNPRRSIVLCLSVLALALPASAGGLDDFKLLKAVPADVFVAGSSRNHDGMKFVNAQWQRVFDELAKQRIDRDLKRFIQGQIKDEGGDPEQFEQQWQQFSDLLAAVEWCGLCEREMAFAMKLAFPVPEMVLLFMPAADRVASDFEGMSAIVKTLIGLAPEGEFVLNTDGTGDTVVHTITVANAPFPIAFLLARHKDTIVAGIGQSMPAQTLTLLKGEKGTALATSERFQAAFKKLPPPADAAVFFDAAGFMSQCRTYLDAVIGSMSNGGAEPPDLTWVGKLIDALDMWEYVASTSTTQGTKTTAQTITLLRENAPSKPFYAVLANNGTLKDPLKYIPQNADACTVTSGFDPMALYKGLIDFIGKEVPDGQAAIAHWNEVKTMLPVDIENDVLSWIGGGFKTFSLPGQGQYAPGDWAMMLTVRDEARARQILDQLTENIGPKLEEQRGAITEAKVEGAEGFRTVTHPMLMMLPMLAAPTFGVAEGHLILASSPKAISAALAAGRGDAPNFSSNERFLKEGVPPAANVCSFGFSDLSKLGEELSMGLGMCNLISMFNPEVNKDPGAKFLLGVVGKLGTVARKLDFFLSTCSQTTIEGRVLVTKEVVNYREPPTPKIESKSEEPTTGSENPK
jgi:hypothetical protein